ncbi:hypothetical protein BDR07DRAFT_398921 [Suillus spraguei]|nr:hypothetical protein BDR07DRAFT_398921 [Suillus spraguei]
MLIPSMQSEKIVLILTVGVSATPLHASIIGPIAVLLGSSNTRRKYAMDVPCASDVRLVVGSGLLTRKFLSLIYLALPASWRPKFVLSHDETKRTLWIPQGALPLPRVFLGEITRKEILYLSTMEALLQCHSPRRVKC